MRTEIGPPRVKAARGVDIFSVVNGVYEAARQVGEKMPHLNMPVLEIDATRDVRSGAIFRHTLRGPVVSVNKTLLAAGSSHSLERIQQVTFFGLSCFAVDQFRRGRFADAQIAAALSKATGAKVDLSGGKVLLGVRNARALREFDPELTAATTKQLAIARLLFQHLTGVGKSAVHEAVGELFERSFASSLAFDAIAGPPIRPSQLRHVSFRRTPLPTGPALS